MKKISTRIVLTVLICSISMSAMVGGISILRSIQVIQKEAKEVLLATEEAHSRAFNEDLILYENTISNIYQIVAGTIDTIAELEQNLQTVASDKEDVVLAMQNISALTKETAASTEELSATIEEQAATIETISSSTNNLASIIDNLNKLIHRFTL